jgi:hypothetical protein
MRPVLFHSDQSPLDIGTHPPRVVGSVGPLEVDPYFVEGDIFNLEIRSLLENVPTYNHPYMFSFYYRPLLSPREIFLMSMITRNTTTVVTIITKQISKLIPPTPANK